MYSCFTFVHSNKTNFIILSVIWTERCWFWSDAVESIAAFHCSTFIAFCSTNHLFCTPCLRFSCALVVRTIALEKNKTKQRLLTRKHSSSDSHYPWYLDTKMVAISSPPLIVPRSMARQCFNIPSVVRVLIILFFPGLQMEIISPHTYLTHITVFPHQYLLGDVCSTYQWRILILAAFYWLLLQTLSLCGCISGARLCSGSFFHSNGCFHVKRH